MKTLFERCYDHIFTNEGGYVNNKNDKGGETFRGISRRWHSTWEGWKLIDQYKNMIGFPLNAEMDDELLEMVREFYKKKFWDRMNLHLIVNENSVLQLFDMAVNSGIKNAVRLAQIVVNCFPIDGILGPKTAFEINSEGHLFFDKYVRARINYYKDLAANDASQEIFLDGWIRRAKGTKF